jgi:hypothetical protein
MPGIADVQPKSIGSIGSLPDDAPVIQPVAWNQAQAPDFSAALTAWNQARQSGSQRQVEAQKAAEFASPEQVAARAAQTSAAGATAARGEANLSSSEALAAYSRYNASPPLGKDGKVDLHAQAEMGMNYLRAEWMGEYAKAGLTPSHTVPTRVGNQIVNVYQNQFLENPFDEKVKAKYQKIWNDSALIKMSPGKQDSWTTPGDHAVADEESPPESSSVVVPFHSPEAMSDVSGRIAPVVAPVSTDIAPSAITPTMVVPNSNQPVLPSDVVSQATAPFFAKYGTSGAPKPQIFDLRDLDNYRAGQASAGASPVVLPNTPGAQPDVQALPFAPGAQPAAPKPTIITTPDSHIAVTPIVNQASPPAALPQVNTPLGMGIPAGWPPGYSSKEIVAATRTSPMYKNWEPLAAPIGQFNSAIAAYNTLPKGKATVGIDKELATALIRMQNPAGNSRGLPEYHLDKLEDAAPILEKIPAFAKLALRTEAYTKDTRDRLIAAGKRIKESVEAPARSQMELTVRQLSASGVDPRSELSDYELGLLGGGTGGGTVGERRKLADGTSVRIKQ